MFRIILFGACLLAILLAGAVQGQTEAPVAIHVGIRQQLQQELQPEQQYEAVQPPTVHLRKEAGSPPPPDEHDDPSSIRRIKHHAKQPQQPVYQPHTPGFSHRPRVPLSAVITMSAFMSLMSCLGALPYFFFKKLSKPWEGLANAVASGVMLAASFGLLAEGAPYSGTYLVAGVVLGVMFVRLSQEHLEQYEVDSFEQLAGADARKIILFLAVMAVHAVGEGGGVGVSFAGDRGWAQGTLVTLAIGLHNVPEGLAVATVMAAKGTPPARILLWTGLTALPQALVAPLAYVFVDAFKALLPLAMGFAAGCMIWIVLAELLPEAFEAVESEQVATYATGSAAWLQGLSAFLSHLETPAGTLASPFGDYIGILPGGIWPVVLHLLPALVAPGLVAAVLAQGSWPRPLLLGVSVGLLSSHATVALLQLLLGSHQPLLKAVLLPLIGAGCAALLWGHLQRGWLSRKALGGTGTGHGSCSTDADGVGAFGSAAAYDGGLLQQQQWQKAAHLQQQQQQQPGATVVTGPQCGYSLPHHRASHAAGQEGFSAPVSRAVVHFGSSWQQPQQHQHFTGRATSSWQQCPAAPAPLGCSLAADMASPTTPGAGGVSSSSSSTAWDAQSTSSKGSCTGDPNTNSYLEEQQRQQHLSSFKGHRSGSYGSLGKGSPLPLPGRGDCVLPVTRRLSGAGWWPGLQDESNRAVTGMCMLALLGAACSGVPLGFQLAGALAAAPHHMGHVLPPLLLIGCLFGAACVGLLIPLLGHGSKLLGPAATLLSSAPAIAAVTALMCKPHWVQQGAAFVAADSTQGFTAGFSLFVLLLRLMPMCMKWGAKNCYAGVVAGAIFGVGISGALSVLCLSSPYCLHVRPVDAFGSTRA